MVDCQPVQTLSTESQPRSTILSEGRRCNVTPLAYSTLYVQCKLIILLYRISIFYMYIQIQSYFILFKISVLIWQHFVTR